MQPGHPAPAPRQPQQRMPVHMPPQEAKGMQSIFPQYLDAQLTPKQGRRLTKAQAVWMPTIEEIITALRKLGFRNIAVDPQKSLPCVQGLQIFPLVPRGCIKVQIKEPASEHYIKKSEFDSQTRGAVVQGLESKHQVLVKVAALIKANGRERPTMPSVDEVLAASLPNQPKTKK